MKKIPFTLALIIINISFLYAQNLKPNAIIKGRSASFITKQTQYGNSMYVVNSKNSFYKKAPKNMPSDITIERNDKNGLLTAFRQVFSDSRLRQLLPENYMGMQIYISPSGNILEIVFNLNKNTLITSVELEDLEKAIKNNVVFKLRSEQTKGAEFFVVPEIVKYSRVLDGTLK